MEHNKYRHSCRLAVRPNAGHELDIYVDYTAVVPCDPGESLLASAANFRDLAGPGAGYPVSGGRRMRRGLLFRSNELQLSVTDAARVAALGVTEIYDLRTPTAIRDYPDTRVPGGRTSESRASRRNA
jgi:hypothetical protein